MLSHGCAIAGKTNIHSQVKGQYENNYLDQPKEEEGYWDIMPKYSEYGHPVSPTEGLLPETPEHSQQITGSAGRHLNYSKPIH